MSVPVVGDENPFEQFALRQSSDAGTTTRRIGARGVSSPDIKHRKGCGKRLKLEKKVSSVFYPRDPIGLLEKYRSPGCPEWPLRLLIVGHNPSEKAWQMGHYYANPSNRMWKLLSTAGIVPSGFTAKDDDRCPIVCGVGFTDVGFSHPGTTSGEFKRKELHEWRQDFYKRLAAHATQAMSTAAAADAHVLHDSAASHAGHTVNYTLQGYPKIVAFAGKRQWEELFFDASAEAKAQTKGGATGPFKFGLQSASLRPPNWPFPAGAPEVYVLPSSSGAAAMTNAAREGPYLDLGKRLSQLSWDHKPIN